MKRIFLVALIVISGLSIARAGTLYDSPNIATNPANSPPPLGNMGLAGTFNFYASTLTGGKTNPPLSIGTTQGIYAPFNLGIEMATGTFRTWIKSASGTISGQFQAGTFRGDGSGLFNLSTGGVLNPIAVAADTTTIYNQLRSTSIALSQFSGSVLSTYTALTSTGIYLYQLAVAANSTMTALSVSSASLYQNLSSTGVSLSRLWTSALSSWTALNSTGIAFSNYVGSANSTMTALSISTNTLRIATSTLQGITSALTVSTGTLSTSTDTLKSRLDAFLIVNSSVQTRIDQLQVHTSTAQQVILALGQSTTTAGMRLSSGAVSVYSGGSFLGNATTLNLGTNLFGTISGSTVTLIAITTVSVSATGRTAIFLDNSTISYITVSSLNILTTEFGFSTGGISGSSITLTISNATHTFTAAQYFSSATAGSLGLFGALTSNSNAVFDGSITSSGGITSISLSTYPTIILTASDQVWTFTTRTTLLDKFFVLKDNTNGRERLQINVSSGNFAIGGDTTTGLNGTSPTSKLDVVNGSVTVRGTGAGLIVAGSIRSQSVGFVFPDGTTQNTSATSGGIIFATDTSRLGSTATWTAPQTVNSTTTFNAAVKFSSSASFPSTPLIFGTSDYSLGANGIFLTANQTGDNSGQNSPVLKFFTTGDANLGATISQVISSFTIRASTNNISPQSATTSRLSFLNNSGVEVVSIGQNGLGIFDRYVDTESLFFSIWNGTFSVTSVGKVGIGTNVPVSLLDIFGGSVSIRGTNAALRVDGVFTLGNIGDASNPQFVFSNDKTTGFYSLAGLGQWGFSSGGTSILGFYSGGISAGDVTQHWGAPDGTVDHPGLNFANTSGFSALFGSDIIVSVNTTERFRFRSSGGVMVGKTGGDNDAIASLVVSTLVTNRPMLLVSSETAKFQVDGSSIWANAPLYTSSGIYISTQGIVPVKPIGNYGVIYSSFDVSSSTTEIFVMDGGGNRTKISPHNSKGEWVFDSENKNGEAIYINMERFIRDFEAKTGERYIFRNEAEEDKYLEERKASDR